MDNDSTDLNRAGPKSSPEDGRAPSPDGARGAEKPFDATDRNESVSTLLRRLVNEAATLFSKEMALARSEFSHAVTSAQAGAVSIATGGAVLFAGFLFLLGAAFLGLTIVVAAWLAALIVGGVTAVVGLIMVAVGKSKMSANSFRMERTTESLRHDREMARGKAA